MEHPSFHENLKDKINTYVHLCYHHSRSFSKEELFGVTSQLRRATLSIMLNYVEGYARGKDKVHQHFLEIAFGSLQESVYLLEFCKDENYFDVTSYLELKTLADEIGAMLWGIIRKLEQKNTRKA